MNQFEGLITFERQIFHEYSINSLTASPYVVIGSDNVQQKVAIEILCEIRFIRKEEVRKNENSSNWLWVLGTNYF